MTTVVESRISNGESGSSPGSNEPTLQASSSSNENILKTSDSTSSLCSEIASVKSPLKRSSSSMSSHAEYKSLPRFTATAPEGLIITPSPRIPTSPVCSDFTAPKFPKALSRPNSPSNAGRPIPPRSRIANIRRESDCSVETEVAHERYIKAAVQVSTGFEDFSLDDKVEDRKRAKSLTDPISITILTSTFQACSQSPTRTGDVVTKQCYSPSTQQLVRSNISYSPSPSPTPSSPKRSRIMRSMSPIVTRQIAKRRYTGSGNASGLDSDSEGPPLSSKRQCTSISKNLCGSPLVRDAPALPNQFGEQRPSTPLSECSTTSSILSFKPRQLLDPVISACINNGNIMDSDDSVMDMDNGSYNDAPKDDQSSTCSSRAGTPVDEQFSDTSRPGDDTIIIPSTTPTGLIRSVQAASPNPFAGGRLPLPPSPLASQRLRDEF